MHLGHDEQAYQIPAYEAICDLLYRRCIARATAVVGVDGTVPGRRQRRRLPSRQAGAPMMVIAVGFRIRSWVCCPMSADYCAIPS